MEIIDTTKSLIENLYLISGPILLISIIIGIYQLNSSKKLFIQAENVLDINSKRDSIKFAIEQHKYIQDKLIPLELEIMEIKSKNKLKIYKYNEEFKHFTINELKSFGNDKMKKYLSNSGDLEYTKKAIELVMKLNMISVPFNTLVADDEIGFKSFGIYYCKIIESYYPMIALLREQENDFRYNDIRELYNRWNKKLEETKIDEELNNLIKKKNEIKTEIKKPIGTR
jgi:hypothetical protein